jgi:hypothetical protein
MFGSFGAQKCLTHLGKIMNGEKESTPSSLKPFLNKKNWSCSMQNRENQLVLSLTQTVRQLKFTCYSISIRIHHIHSRRISISQKTEKAMISCKHRGQPHTSIEELCYSTSHNSIDKPSGEWRLLKPSNIKNRCKQSNSPKNQISDQIS